jgi:hydroxypyruvate isomerase
MEIGLCIEMAFSRLPFKERIKKAAELGFANVEMWFVDMSFKGKPDELAKIAQENEVNITNTVIGAPDGSIGGGLTNPANRGQWLQRARMTIEFNKEAQIPATIVCTGNLVKGMSDKQMMQSVIDGLKHTVNLAEKADITLLLEPLNDRYDHPGYFLTSSNTAADICRQCRSDHLKLLYDCYHMQIMEGDIIKHIEKNIDVIGHFHSAGVPGRHELYNGEINYPFVISQIKKLGYQGVFALEYEPSIDDEQSVSKTLQYLGLPNAK